MQTDRVTRDSAAVERVAHNHEVAGSSPAPATILLPVHRVYSALPVSVDVLEMFEMARRLDAELLRLAVGACALDIFDGEKLMKLEPGDSVSAHGSAAVLPARADEAAEVASGVRPDPVTGEVQPGEPPAELPSDEPVPEPEGEPTAATVAAEASIPLSDIPDDVDDEPETADEPSKPKRPKASKKR